MALKQIGFVELVSAVQQRIESETGLRCYDVVPVNAENPFYIAEAVSKKPDNSKTFFRDVFTIWVHCIADGKISSGNVYDMIKQLDEAMTEEIELDTDYWLQDQIDAGVQNIFDEETGEKHAVCAFEFRVCYGFKTKN